MEYERSWYILHTDVSVFCLGLWYRPPAYGEVDSIYSLKTEYEQFSVDCIGSIIIGDMNVHHKTWLKYSNGITLEGRALFDVCFRYGLHQCVQSPTRGSYLLDLVLTNVEALLKTKVLPKVADHNLVLSTVRATVIETIGGKRKVWQYASAKWEQMKQRIIGMDWLQAFEHGNLDEIVGIFTKILLDLVHEFVPTTWVHKKISSHPWLSKASWKSIALKRSAEGTDDYGRLQLLCNRQVREDYEKYIEKMKNKVSASTGTPKAWWKLSSRLMLKDASSGSIPPLQAENGTWSFTSKSKADLLASTLGTKFQLPEEIKNDYSNLDPNTNFMQSGFLPVRLRVVRKILKNLELDSLSGPDLIATRILKKFADYFVVPVVLLCRRILLDGCWPSTWKIHWVLPLYKKKSKACPANYRGIHLTSQLSKVVERVLAELCMIFLETSNTFGHNQFAYRKTKVTVMR